jgi:polyhydroxyalkanoate synthesis regulator phasin
MEKTPGGKAMSVLKRAMLFGVGVASITKEKAEEIVEDLVKRGEVAAGDRAKAIEEIHEKAMSAAADVKKLVDERVDAMTRKFKWLDDMRRLQSQVQELNARLDQLEKTLNEREHHQ